MGGRTEHLIASQGIFVGSPGWGWAAQGGFLARSFSLDATAQVRLELVPIESFRRCREARVRGGSLWSGIMKGCFGGGTRVDSIVPKISGIKSDSWLDQS